MKDNIMCLPEQIKTMIEPLSEPFGKGQNSKATAPFISETPQFKAKVQVRKRTNEHSSAQKQRASEWQSDYGCWVPHIPFLPIGRAET